MSTLVHLDPRQTAAVVQTVPGGAGNVQDIYPLTSSQAGLLFHHLLSECGGAYTRSTLLELRSAVHLEALIAALQHSIDRHDILRSAILWEQLPQPVQVVYRRAVLPVERLAPVDDRDALGLATAQRWELRRAPLMRLRVIPSTAGDRLFA